MTSCAADERQRLELGDGDSAAAAAEERIGKWLRLFVDAGGMENGQTIRECG
jgi:hypothetical protein